MNLRLPGFAVVLLASVVLVDAFMVLVVNLAYDGYSASDWIAFYTGGTLVREGLGGHLYDANAQAAVQRGLFGSDAGLMGYPLPAFAAYLFAPLTRLSFVASYWVWFAVNLALLAVLVRSLWSLLDETSADLRAKFLVCVSSVPVLNVLLRAQVDLFVLAGFAACYALLHANRPFSAGAALALGLFKPHLLLAPLALLVVKRQWRALAGFLTVGVPLLLVPSLALGSSTLVDQAGLVTSLTRSPADYSIDAEMMVNLRGTIASLTGSSNVWLWLPLLSIVGAVALLVAVRIWVARPLLDLQSWALVFSLPFMYAPHIHVQTLVLLVAGAALYVAAAQRDAQRLAEINRYLIPVLAATLVLLTLSQAGVTLMALLVIGAYVLFVYRWPRPSLDAVYHPAAPLEASHRRSASPFVQPLT